MFFVETVKSSSFSKNHINNKETFPKTALAKPMAQLGTGNTYNGPPPFDLYNFLKKIHLENT